MINDINFDGERLLPVGVTLHGHSIIKKDNAIEDTRNFCQNLMSNEVNKMNNILNYLIFCFMDILGFSNNH